MKIIHTADWHFSYKQYGYDAREEDIYKSAEHIAKTCDGDIMILAGDLFDTVRPSATSVERAQSIIRSIKSRGIRVFGIDGNHDKSDGKWLGICDIEILDKPVKIGNLTIAGIPNQRPAIFKYKLRELLEHNKVDVLVIHQIIEDIAGLNFGSDVRLEEFAELLNRSGVKVILMGDLHDYKEVELYGVRCIYAGSIEVMSVSENLTKSYSVIDIGDNGKVTTSYNIIPTRKFEVINVRNELDLDKVKTLVKEKGESAFIAVYADLSVMGTVKEFFQNSAVMHRIIPVATGDNTDQLNADIQVKLDRNLLFEKLTEAVKVWFPPESDESHLIFDILKNPNNTDTIVNTYIEGTNNGGSK